MSVPDALTLRCSGFSWVPQLPQGHLKPSWVTPLALVILTIIMYRWTNFVTMMLEYSMFSLCKYIIEGISCQLHQWGLFLGESYSAHLKHHRNFPMPEYIPSQCLQLRTGCKHPWGLVNIHAAYTVCPYILLYTPWPHVVLFSYIHECIYIYWDCQKVYRINMQRAYTVYTYVWIYAQICPTHMHAAIGHSGTLELQCVQGHISRPSLPCSS